MALLAGVIMAVGVISGLPVAVAGEVVAVGWCRGGGGGWGGEGDAEC